MLIFSCKKEDGSNQNTVTPGSYRSLDEAVASTAPIARSTSISVSAGDTLYGPGGTRFVIPANVFETLTGGKVTGSVQVTINDWIKKGDMVFGRVLPIMYFKADADEPTYEKPLLSAGEAFIQVTQNGQILRIRKDTNIWVQFPQFGVNVPDMTGWSGRTMIGSANTVNWQSVDTPWLFAEYLTDTLSVRSDTLHYIQAALPFNFGNSYLNFTVRLNSPVALEQSMAVAMYANNNALFPLPSVVGGEIKAVGIPASASTPLQIVVMGINKGNFYGGIVDVASPTLDSIYQVTVLPMEPPTLKLMLNAL
jgi:hypothetical protein